jgi:hypothetical protein
MNGSEGATCLAYPITHAKDTNDLGSLKNDRCFFQKENPIDTSSPESVTFFIYVESRISTNVEI